MLFSYATFAPDLRVPPADRADSSRPRRTRKPTDPIATRRSPLSPASDTARRRARDPEPALELSGLAPEAAVAEIARVVVQCERCPRLREHGREVARVKRRAYRDEEYWGRPVPSFGDPEARVLIAGLAPAAHGGNRTGRIFTGDPSGSWLYAALHRYGFANLPDSVGRDDGMRLTGVYVTAAAHCAPPQNQPTRKELENCRPYLAAELSTLPRLEIVLALGAVAWDAVLRVWTEAGHRLPRPKPRFGHGAEVRIGDGLPWLLGSYHPSRRNTQTGLLTRPMFHGVFHRVTQLLGGPET